LQIAFEIIMVDDGSTDGTGELMKLLEKKYKYVRCLAHEKNRGGGAARNTGIRQSDGDLIFCLDSDDVLPAGSLAKMIDRLDEKKCDGVVFEKNIYFKDDINSPLSEAANKVSETPLSLTGLFDDQEKSFMTLSNFLYAREAYTAAGGYPEHHSFDTQHFGYVFLSRGLKAYTCPGAFYYIRIGYKNRTYFQRAYEAGDMSINMYLIYEDIIHLLSPRIIKEIFYFDIFQKTKMVTDEIAAYINSLYAADKNDFFIQAHENYLQPDGFKRRCESIGASEDLAGLFMEAICLHKDGRYSEALEKYQKLAAEGIDSKVMYFNVMRCMVALTGKYGKAETEKEALKISGSMRPKKQKVLILPPKLTATLVKIKNILKI
jgi:glycosyltransferase involved in cell wall biosynthesis